MNLGFYRKPVDLSAAGKHAPLLKNLPRDVGALARVVQGLLIHEHMTEAYGVKLSPERHAEAHVRPLEAMLDRIVAADPRPLSAQRAPEGRYVCVCRSFTLLMVALLRHQGVPARARCGFGTYFEKGKGYDHWVAEYWREAEKRWVMVDAQIDDRQRQMFGIAIDTPLIVVVAIAIAICGVAMLWQTLAWPTEILPLQVLLVAAPAWFAFITVERTLRGDPTPVEME